MFHWTVRTTVLVAVLLTGVTANQAEARGFFRRCGSPCATRCYAPVCYDVCPAPGYYGDGTKAVEYKSLSEVNVKEIGRLIGDYADTLKEGDPAKTALEGIANQLKK